MELHQIRYFLAVCGTLNFTRASEQCHVSQPSLTRAVKKLESELGGELFRRERSRTHLTELGLAMQPYLQQSLDSAMAAKVLADSLGRGEAAPLHLGISGTVEIGILLPMLHELAQSMPGLKLTLVRAAAEDIIQKLEDGELELCITALGDIAWERIDQWPLFTENFVLITKPGHILNRPETVDLAELEGQHLVAQPHCESAGALSDILEDRQIAMEGYHEPSNLSDLIALVGEGLGLGIAPRSTNVSGEVTTVPIKEPALRRTVSLFAVSGRRYSPAAAGLINLLRAADWSRHEQLSN